MAFLLDDDLRAILAATRAGCYVWRGMLCRDLPDGRLLGVYALTLGRGRLGVGPRDGYGFDDEW